tara:strand:+ start:491 stop:1378 length:888 start_codon:yes stop_codon:yes gene_type:complete
MVGSSVVRNISKLVDSFEVIKSTRDDTDLFSKSETESLIDKVKPDVIINAAAKVGGILANDTNRTEFILDNLKINMNILESLINKPNVKLINLGSSCIYPLGVEVPIKEESLMTGKLEPTNSPYAMAKLTAIEIADAIKKEHGNEIINLMPTNLYGPYDNFSEKNSHVIPGLIYRMHKAKNNNEESFFVWGTGKPKREFLHVDDLSSAIIFLLNNNTEEEILNIGSGEEISISELVEKIKKIINYTGEIKFDDKYPDGNPRKLLDSSKINSLGWKPEIKLDKGLENVYEWYSKNK